MALGGADLDSRPKRPPHPLNMDCIADRFQDREIDHLAHPFRHIGRVEIVLSRLHETAAADLACDETRRINSSYARLTV